MDLQTYLTHLAEIEELMSHENDIAYFSDGIVHYPYLNKKYMVSGPDAEEVFRAKFLLFLVNFVGYEKEYLDVQVPITWGSRGSGYADIVIYDDPTKREQFLNIKGIIELKAEKPEIPNQLESYMTASSAWWGFWSDGKSQKFVYKDVMGRCYDDKIVTLPCPGDTPDDLLVQADDFGSKYKYIKGMSDSGLITLTRKELDAVIQKCRDHIWHGHKSDSEISSELNKLITAKLYDETEGTTVCDPYKFQIGSGEKNVQVANRIRLLTYQAVSSYNDSIAAQGLVRKSSAKDSYVNVIDPQLKIDDAQIVKVVKELEGIAVSQSDADVRGRIFENVIHESYRAKGGQYFTPREIVKFATYMVDIDPRYKLLDPACGTGGFLLYGMVYGRAKIEKQYRVNERQAVFDNFAKHRIYGIEKSEQLAQIAQTDLRLHGDGSSHITWGDSLEDINILSSMGFRPNSFRYILTNPPFGKPTRISDPAILNRFQLGRGKSSQDACVLILERSYEFLENNGKLAIILPDTVIGRDASYADVRQFIKTKFKIEAIISLPQHTFKIAKANVGGYLLFLSKQKPPQDYSFFMAIATHIGYKNNKSDDNNLMSDEIENLMNDDSVSWDEFNDYLLNSTDSSILALYKRFVKGMDVRDPKVKVMNFSSLKESLECKAYMYENPFSKTSYPLTTLGNIMEAVKIPTVLNDPDEMVKQLTITQTGEVKLRNNKLIKAKEIETKDIYIIPKDTVVVSLIDFYRGNVGYVPEELDGAISTWWFVPYKPRQGYTMEYLLYLLQHKKMRKYAESLTSGMTGRKYMEESDLLLIQVPDLPLEKQKEIIDSVNSSLQREIQSLDVSQPGFIAKLQSAIRRSRDQLTDAFDAVIFGAKGSRKK